MADWSTKVGWQRAESYVDASNSRGIAVASGASADTKGNYVQLTASSGFDAEGIFVDCQTQSVNGAIFLIDISVGAALSEEVIIPDLLLDTGKVYHNICCFFPISIPSGTRIAARAQRNTAGATNTLMAVTIVAGGFLTPSPLGRVTAYGVDTANTNATSFDPGATPNTKGSWSEIVASTTNPIKDMDIVFGLNGDFGKSSTWNLIDIGIGAGGSEVVVIPDIFIATDNGGDSYSELVFHSRGLNIPSGTRIAARAQTAFDNGDPDRLIHIALYGID